MLRARCERPRRLPTAAYWYAGFLKCIAFYPNRSNAAVSRPFEWNKRPGYSGHFRDHKSGELRHYREWHRYRVRHHESQSGNQKPE